MQKERKGVVKFWGPVVKIWTESKRKWGVFG